MNDFTKEELEYILASIYYNELEHHLEENIPDFPKKLMEKIQTMIDNYCEHESCAIDYDYQPLRCKVCKEIVE